MPLTREIKARVNVDVRESSGSLRTLLISFRNPNMIIDDSMLVLKGFA